MHLIDYDSSFVSADIVHISSFHPVTMTKKKMQQAKSNLATKGHKPTGEPVLTFLREEEVDRYFIDGILKISRVTVVQ